MNDSTDVLGRRIGAGLLDLLVLFVLLIVVGVIFGEDETSGSSVSVTLEGLSAIVFAVVAFAYYGVLEATSGQTLGKKLLGIRVAKLDGSKPGGGAIAARTVLRIIDGIFFYLVGLVVILVTGQKRQRIGDLAGGTTVVRA